MIECVSEGLDEDDVQDCEGKVTVTNPYSIIFWLYLFVVTLPVWMSTRIVP
jgi:hypothetical protein